MDKRYILILIPLILGVKTNSSSKRETNPRATEIQCGDVYHKKCQQSKYRTFDGSCNNKMHPTWGMPYTRNRRLIPANYHDGVHAPRLSKSGKPLPNPRTLSRTLNPESKYTDYKFTLATMQWGQIITHDMNLVDPRKETPDNQCCHNGKLDKDYMKKALCFPVIVPKDDKDYKKSGIECMGKFIRTNTDLNRGCNTHGKAAEQLTIITAFLDLSLVYASSDKEASDLRAKKGGLLLVKKRNNQEWLPIVKEQFGVCNGTQTVCYKAGDPRVNQNTHLTILQTILVKEHNRIARVLAKLNSKWTDEKIFQETRRILIAVHQWISYYEWLPLVLGQEDCYHRKLIYKTQGYVNDYDPTVDPSILNEHTSAAFRSLHTTIAGRLDLMDEDRKSATSSVRLSDHIADSTIVEKSFVPLTRGLFTQDQDRADKCFTKEITLFFAKGLAQGKKKLGVDLRAIDIQRNRDHGLATYNQYRKYCGFREAKDWHDFNDLIPSSDVEKMSKLYESPDDVDLPVGATLEKILPGALVGATNHCILNRQFLHTRKGDRYWFENGNNGAAFTLKQLKEIRKSSISRLVCDNGNGIHSMQRKGFERISKNNPLVSCKDIPSINLNLWQEGSENKGNKKKNNGKKNNDEPVPSY
ncbi:peroxidase-like [Belonocnema kinseyi]|uniref:peroxidase-like n=1 Tax=Belonocnema kinseyi TaxID=2817044 RepID=UPI00143CFEF7|nr:peroxidase-like [Belonocnema kinseyi]XP_033217522.1 peroxidase-like [Belonocnema kinseyi]XP_033217523.1 peroxidase-like [Belonocnema kinseyi]XP_033217524.1 peroxidase-like [Belonocnema kinseyi]XP_033217525.1 peroxidase-like [Belonocnema kinseyi]XP_033217526.1 peroxidase-like [Belonocnema kinseyi]